uniref:Sacsin/Nov domain-containing protein n=1 Tax=Davidia involucrata TaxID=16924 RepID=A0A5B6Z3I5_DAVIN
MATPREHIEEIRRKKFYIGLEEENPLAPDLYQAVNYLSAELYTKDCHFLMEIIQNAEDNEYLEGVDPSLEFVITSRDITATGAPATLLVFNNERGFSPKNIESICSVGRSTKKGNRKRGYIGEKGIGFKSVFLITAQPYIFSNGYQIRFNEEPCSNCNLGYIIPEWVDENPTLSVIKQIYGSGNTLPITTIVLPLKHDKVNPVKQQLSSIHPEVLLFLSKIKQLSVREDNEDPRLNTVNSVSISSEINFVTKKNIDADSYTLHLSADKTRGGSERECSYHMWRQRFPVRHENRVERRMEVDELVITLAFPIGQRLHRDTKSPGPGVYAFLPTEMVTNLPFIIQADFLLASSRETILLDNKWNQGILDCVPSAFINAFISLVKGTEDAPLSSLPPMFVFLPVNISSYPQLNVVRETIKAKLVGENIVPCESYMEQKFFHKPCEVGRLMPAFWSILNQARKQRVSLQNISSHGRYVLCSSFDKEEYNHILDFLGVGPVNDEWYAKCIRGSNLVLGVSEDVYIELLLFLAENWLSHFQKTDIKNIPLLKYVGLDDNVSLCTINEVLQLNHKRLLLSYELRHMSWLIDWNKEFGCAADHFFVPESMEEAILSYPKRQTILEWLSDQVKVKTVTVYKYAGLLNDSLSSDRKLVITYVHFLFHSLSKNYLSAGEVDNLCGIMPLVDNYGRVTTSRSGVLVPANGSKWVGLIGSNPWRKEGYVELGEDYLNSGNFAGVCTPQKELIMFLKSHLKASDVPNLSPPNAVIPTMSAPLTKRNTFLLLDWIRNLKQQRVPMPSQFLSCIKEGSWLRVSLNGSPGHRPPPQSFLSSSSWGSLLQNGSVLVDIPIIDQGFYGCDINGYKEELRTIGVMFEYGEACQFIGNHFMSLAASSNLTKVNVLSILNFIKFLREELLSPAKFISCIKEGRWLRTTSHGYRSPVGSVLFDQEWRAAQQISDIPFIDQDYYGEEILCFKTELQLLGVVVGFNQNYQIVADNLKSSASFTALQAEAVLLMLECICYSTSSDKFVRALKDQKFLKTNMGYKSPFESYLFDPEWVCLLQVFNSFAFVDRNFYGSRILSYRNELKKIGVKVDFKEAAKAFASVFRQQASLFSIRKENVLSFLECCRKLKGTAYKFPSEISNCIREAKWLRTRLGDYRVPKECILFGPEWESISQISLLPFVDDSDNYYGKGIYEYKKELIRMGVVSAFKDGSKFVTSCLYLPQNPSSITPASVYSLLECIRNIQPEPNVPLLPDGFQKKVARKWLKTNAGYRAPDKCLLFDSNWYSFLRREDGPFIDEEFYGSNIKSYKKELNELGVIVDKRNGCSLLASHLDFHSKFTTIVRIYNYLNDFNWEPENDGEKGKIWIPNGSDDGKWVSPGECVLHNKDDLFGMQLNVLEKHYDRKLLSFFSNAFGVKFNPSVVDYCKIWKVWENSGHRLRPDECRAFWEYVIKHWNSKTQKILTENLLKLPVCSGPDGILLFDKSDVFIADDLQLKDLFARSSSRPLFVWYPQPSLPSLPRTELLEIYSNIGVRTISESVQREEVSVMDGVGLKEVNPRKILIGKGLFRLILGFLADPSLKMEAAKRHEAVGRLLNLTVLETLEPITVGYSLSLSSGDILNVKASRMMRWERESLKFFKQKLDMSGGQKSMIEYATYFSEVVSEGVLWEKEDQMWQLAELMRLGFLVKFNEEAIGFLLKTKNLQIYLEDEEFLSSVFPAV